jgi:hypothetical protein
MRLIGFRNPLVLTAGLALAALAALSGCATIISGSKQEVTFNSNPQAAEVLIYQGYAPAAPGAGDIVVFGAKTPAVASLPRGKWYTAVVRAPGYAEVRVRIDKEFNLWVLGNILCGGLLGGAIDYLTGAFWKLDPDDVMVSLVPGAGAAPPAPGSAPSAPSTPGAPAVSPAAAIEGNAVDLYAVFIARDSEGQMRSISIPMIRDRGALAAK